MPSVFSLMSIIFVPLSGLISILILYRLYKEYEYKYILIFLFCLFFFNAAQFLNLSGYYLFNSFQLMLQSDLKVAVLSFFLIISLITKYLWCYTFASAFFCLFNKPVFRIFKIGFICICLLFFTFYSVMLYRSMESGNLLFLKNTTQVILLQFVFIVLAILFFSIYYSERFCDSSKVKTIRLYIFPLAFFWIMILVTAIINYFTGLRVLVTAAVICTELSFNILPVFVFRRIVSVFRYPEDKEFRPDSGRESLFEKFNISKREQEIILHVCLGKSNQQIADELFISLYTVKDHIQNIFKKTSVKNRTQLSNLFR